MSIDEAKQRTATVWGLGEYSQLSVILRPAAQALCDACAVGAGQEVLDVAAGDGNFAMACAFEGASVVASDLSPGMVERGKARSDAEGYDVEWVEADAEALPFEDGRFECVGSVFGAMIAPRPRVAAEELFRVVRPGNTVGMTAWTPESKSTELFRIARSYAPAPPEGTPAIEEWGVEENVRERFDGLANTIEFERRTLPWGAESPAAFLAEMEASAPPQVALRSALDDETYAEMRSKQLDLVREWADGDGPFEVEAEYLLFVARRRG